MRKLLSVILALAMVLSVFSPVFAEEEAPKTEEAAKPALEKHIEFLKEQGIIKGDKNGDLLLEKNIDRAEFAAILVRADGKEATAESVKTLPGRFVDIDANHWGNGYATVAHDNGWMKGNPAGEFMPGKEISYAEIATTLVRFLGKEKVGFVYPTSYIAAATELGLFQDVEIGGVYTANAKRDHVFHMLYNALSKEDFGKYNVYKTIVLENNRVAQLSGSNVKAEVLSVVQVANNVDERGNKKVGEQFVLDLKGIKVEGGLADSENLLGKVVDFTLDENNKVVKAVVDNSYDYVYGPFSASDKNVWVNYVKYSARVDERYYRGYGDVRTSERDDRVYRTYLTDASGHKFNYSKNFNFQDFVKKLNLNEKDKDYKTDKIDANFARVTVKDGMVLFVDAYNLEDIAPVKEVAREGQEVYFYNDARNAAVERQIVKGWERVVGFNAKDGFFNYDRKDIKADDTIHWMEGFYLVRTDAKIDRVLDKTYIDAVKSEYAVLKDKEDKTEKYYLNTDNDEGMQAVFAYDDNHYRTLTTREQIEAMRGSEVKVLLDVFGDVQLITSHEKVSDRLGLVNKNISAKGMEFYAANAPEEAMFRLFDDWDSNYFNNDGWNESTARRFDGFNRLDLAYTTSDKDGNARVVATIPGFEYSLTNGAYKNYSWMAVEFDKYKNFINYDGMKMKYTDQTDVFVINEATDKFGRKYRNAVISKITLADVKKNNENNKDLKAVVLTEKVFEKFLEDYKMPTWGRVETGRPDFAKAIIFTNYQGPRADVHEYGRIIKVHNFSNLVTIEVSPGVYEDFRIDPTSPVDMKNNKNAGQFVEFVRTEEKTDKMAAEARFEEIIALDAKEKVMARTTHVITLDKDYFITKDTKEFGNPRDGYAYILADENNFAKLIVYGAVKEKEQPTLADKLAAKKFEEMVGAFSTPATLEEVEAALNAYNKLSDAAKSMGEVKKAKAKLDKAIADVLK